MKNLFDYKNDKLLWKSSNREAVSMIRHGRQYTRLPNKSTRPTALVVYEWHTGVRLKSVEFLDGNSLNYAFSNLCDRQVNLTQDWVKAVFNYAEGHLYRKSNGERVGYLDPTTGYIKFSSNSRTYGLHQLIWLFFNKDLPKMIDHIDQDKTNNRIDNLREADPVLNRANTTRKSNKTLPRGVYFGKSGGFQVRITFRNVCKSYGTFNTLEEAAARAKEVYSVLHGGLGVTS
jgi:hypothetical protein